MEIFKEYTFLIRDLKEGKRVEKMEFENFLKKAVDRYYTEEPIISDDDFDFFKKLFVDTYGYSPVSIGSPVGLKGFSKVKHSIPMGSLKEFDTKVDVIQSIHNWAAKNSDKDVYCTSEKADGLSTSFQYVSGVLTQALTRGDGVFGDDITKNAINMNKGNMCTLPIPFTGYLRGEIVLKKSIKKEHFPDFANERNGAVGLTKRIDGVGCDKLSVLFYKVYCKEKTFETETEMFDFIKNTLKLDTPRYYQTNLKILIALHKKYEDEARERLDYLLDGLVVNIDDIDRQIQITDNELLPEYARKFKFEAEKAETELLQVIAQIGRTGAVTPLAILDPVVCGGTLISKATLHNYDEIDRLGVEAGDIVQVIRSKDVIPKIVGVVRKNEYSTPIKRPKTCPVCSSVLEKEDTLYYCRNEYCGARVAKSLLHWLDILGLKNMGEKLVEALIDAGKLKTIPDFYKLKIEDISDLDRQGVRNATKILKELHSKTIITVAELLAGLNIRSLSVKRAEILEDNFGSLDNIMSLRTRDIIKVEGFEEKLAMFITTGLKVKSPLIKEILKYVNLKKKIEGALSNKSFCFSGFRDNDLENKIKAKGGRIASGVNKKLDYLVVINKNGTTSKIKKASEYGIKVLDLSDLEGVIHNTLF